MTSIPERLKDHLSRNGISARTLAERARLDLKTITMLMQDGCIPAAPEQQEALRQELGLDTQTWAEAVAARPTVNVDGLDLGRLVSRCMQVNGLDETSLAQAAGIHRPAILNLVAKGTIPDRETLQRIAEQFALDPDLLQQAIALTRAGSLATNRRTSSDQRSSAQESPVSSNDESIPSLAQLISDTVVKSGSCVAAFAREHDIPYVSLMKLMNSGQPPRRKAVLDPIEKALGITHEQFLASLEKSKANPTPAEAPKLVDRALNAFHAQLLKLVEEKGFTTKAFAEAADISVLTAAKLLKRGDLPGRQTTHEKLRNLMGLGKEEYFALLESARPADEPDHDSTSISTPGYVTVASGAAPIATTKGELFELIDRMSQNQLVTLKQFLLSVL